MTLKLYYDLMSQPSRALYILLKAAKCNVELKLVDLRNGEHYSDEYTKINRFQRVPVIENNGFILSESIAIIRYLANKNLIPDSLYPRNVEHQARVDEFLEWHHISFRLHCSMYFRVLHMNPILTGKQPDPKSVEGYERRMLDAINSFDQLWLGRGTAFISGDTPTVADLFAACELEQTRMVGFNPSDKFPNVAIWWPKVQKFFNPYYQEGHVIVNKIIEKKKKMISKI